MRLLFLCQSVNGGSFVKRLIAALILTAMLLLGAALAETPALKITEACSENGFVWTMGFADYIELHNEGADSIDLSTVTLRVGKKEAVLPGIVLDGKGFLALRCDGQEVGLKLPKEGCTLSLMLADGTVLDEVVLPAMDGKQVWQSGQGLTCMPSPGFDNTEAGEKHWYAEAHGDLVIGEALSTNFRALSHKSERYVDAVEVTNVGKKKITLSDYYLSDSKKNLKKYQLPNVGLEPGSSYVLYCTENKMSQATGFKLSSAGEILYLTQKDGAYSDILNVPALSMDVSYGRTDGLLMYYTTPTIGKPNNKGVRRVAETPVLSVESGMMSKQFSLEISGEGPVYYTLDNSIPTTKSKKYSGPITVSKDTTIRAACIPNDAVPSAAVTAVYVFDYHKTYHLPAAFVTVQQDCLTAKNDSLYKNLDDTSLEVPAHVVYFEDGEARFAMDCGFAIHGHTSRRHPKRNFKLRFRTKYGQNSLNYQIFDDYEVTDFDSIVFRVGTHDLMINDVYGAAVGAETMPEVLYQHYKPVNLFINGKYNGIYYIREHINANFVVNRLGGDPDTVDIVYGPKTTEHGDGTDLFKLLDFCEKEDMSKQENYEYVKERLCIESLIDFYITRPFTGDTDTPNLRYCRSRDAEDNRWHLINYDIDWGWEKHDTGLYIYVFRLRQTEKVNNVMINHLLRNKEFRKLYLERLSMHMKTTFDTDRMFKLLDELNDQLLPDMPLNQKRWNATMNDWNKHIKAIKSFIKDKRVDRRRELAEEVKKSLRLKDDEFKKLFGFLY